MKKFRNILIASLVALTALSLQSCLKNQEDVFTETPPVRMQNVLENTKKVLEAAEYGWLFEMYPGGTEYGGYVYTLKFEDGNVTVHSEFSSEDEAIEADVEPVTSLYRLTNDNGPVLAFDSYNALLHYWSSPGTVGYYTAYEGEFEFVIMDTKSDLITLKGKKTGNTMYLRKLDMDAQEYINQVVALEDEFAAGTLDGFDRGNSLEASIDLSLGSRVITLANGTEEVDVAYVFTPTGIRLYEPVTLGGITYENFTYDLAAYTLTGADEGNTSIVMDARFPEDYVKFEDFAGDYVLAYNANGATKVNVSLTKGQGKTYVMSGINANYTVTLQYDIANGRLLWNSQKVGEANGNDIWLCAWGIAGGGTLTWSTSAGMATKLDMDAEGTVYNWENNGLSSYQIDSFILWQLNNGASAGQFIGWGYYVRYVTSLTKKEE